MSSPHDEEILGKAYDARLMRRLLALSVAVLARRSPSPSSRSSPAALAQLAQPYLIKIAIDRHIAAGQLAGLDRLAAIYLADSGRRRSRPNTSRPGRCS